MAKVFRKKKPLNKNCLSLIQAVLAEDTQTATKILTKLIKSNISKKLRKAERETDLF